MADKTIGELPGISYLDAGSLFVAEQSGQAVKVTGKQLTDFSNVETTAQVEQAKASAQEAKTAQLAAEAAILKGPIIQNGTWWVYNQTAGAYQDTGIKATGPQGIPGPTSSVNGISPDASGNIALTAGNVNAYSKTESDTLLAGKAPAGYGLGTNAKDISGVDFNTVRDNGWYMFATAGENRPYDKFGYSYMLVAKRSNENLTQIVFIGNSSDYAGCIVKRVNLSGTWYPWEWVNPPMYLGVEYRTTERYQGKPVYAKLVSLGVLPNNTSKSVAHGITELATVLYVNGTIGYGTLLADPNVSGITLDNTNITITTTADMSGFISYVMLKYFKYTD